MPIPKPSKGEAEGKFMSRCMSDNVMKREYPDQKQRAAICLTSWKKKKESVDITIEEKSDDEYEIKDYDFEINLENENEKSIVTELINGKLDSIILYTNVQCEVIIRFAKLTDIVIFNDKQFEGTKYLSIRSQTITKDSNLLLSGFSKYLLNNQLEIIIRGQKNTNVGITLRCC